MNNWVKMTNDEMEVGIEIATLKKGELQIKYAKDIVAKDKEIERLNNIINELGKWLIKQQIEEGEFCDFLLENKQIKVEKVLDKLQELKGSDK